MTWRFLINSMGITEEADFEAKNLLDAVKKGLEETGYGTEDEGSYTIEIGVTD